MIDYTYVECTSAVTQALVHFSHQFPQYKPKEIQYVLSLSLKVTSEAPAVSAALVSLNVSSIPRPLVVIPVGIGTCARLSHVNFFFHIHNNISQSRYNRASRVVEGGTEYMLITCK